MEEDIIVCRCEEVTLRELRAALASGGRTAAELENLTRAGLGTGQGRVCRQLVTGLLMNQDGISASTMSISSFRPPVRPVTLAELALLTEVDDAGQDEPITPSACEPESDSESDPQPEESLSDRQQPGGDTR